MATAELLAPSRRLRSAADAERERLGRELAKLDGRARRLHDELEQVEAERAQLREQLALLARLGSAPEDSPFPTTRTPDKAAPLRAAPVEAAANVVLAGARIRETAAMLLASSPNPRRPIHYRQWYRLVREAGYGIDARDPEGTFFTQVGRSPVVRRADAPGVYALDFEAPSVLRGRLHELDAELGRASSIDSTAEVASQRERRDRAIAAIRRTERQLEEALRSLGDAPA